ncbi:segregation and condensation protein A [Clostridium pasteurianum DSM 525 = ATCC 6013]|jgi:segregation and condensation protein A|uniref:Segregation and condensation protein A n=1 Tax=Clostridium pasteurianum DSM 525 = ATCC 6013 TaxID=1262449 RepID=A0A0H3J4S4_CLOPA|nr:segregation/condensation protein A [Clostridium pasteurianum]AJA48002.1 segregation and condensation protein A [Clostridium pasteurianum DSM 525 = ATCC 6013]AJA51990.1 segregation and condensation protein A [Clostridium pasteurianum DSM 525 = ATCC 6013]AOZ75286.1 segregation and condensation protein A [Clostridium pasteurianum DSM 525 = ATCC 6013]AOZ79081.1 segregation and condensation protein A [Clostridium pasteurianum]ELP59905.1 segregation and condensation protein A [Clostridium pasteur
MSINIKLNNFEGPFDLLLHLIKRNKMDIYDIKIYDITSQYLSYIKTMKEMDLEITSEFIVIAANLLEIKSKLLLPKNKVEELEEEGKDPRMDLVSKLVEYKKYKLAADFFKEREDIKGEVFTKKPEIIEDMDKKSSSTEELLKNISMLDLFNLYDNLINTYLSKINKENVISKEIPIDKFRIEDKIEELMSTFKDKKRIFFSDVKKECNSKMEIVVTFLALLELIKLRSVRVIQQANFNEIYIERIFDGEEL